MLRRGDHLSPVTINSISTDAKGGSSDDVESSAVDSSPSPPIVPPLMTGKSFKPFTSSKRKGILQRSFSGDLHRHGSPPLYSANSVGRFSPIPYDSPPTSPVTFNYGNYQMQYPPYQQVHCMLLFKIVYLIICVIIRIIHLVTQLPMECTHIPLHHMPFPNLAPQVIPLITI